MLLKEVSMSNSLQRSVLTEVLKIILAREEIIEKVIADSIKRRLK